MVNERINGAFMEFTFIVLKTQFMITWIMCTERIRSEYIFQSVEMSSFCILNGINDVFFSNNVKFPSAGVLKGILKLILTINIFKAVQFSLLFVIQRKLTQYKHLMCIKFIEQKLPWK